jgi:hypothetical protein
MNVGVAVRQSKVFRERSQNIAIALAPRVRSGCLSESTVYAERVLCLSSTS